MKRKNQLDDDNDNIKKVRFAKLNKRCADEPIFYDDEYGGASDDDEGYYDRKKRLKIVNGFIFKRMIPEKNKNNIPSYIN